MMADAKAAQFISALVKNLQAVCHGHVDFDENIKVVGHLFLTVDSNTEYNYVLNEKVCKTDQSSTTFVSKSFYAVDPQPKPQVKPESIKQIQQQDQRGNNWQTQFPRAKPGNSNQRQTFAQAHSSGQGAHPQPVSAVQNRNFQQKRSQKPNVSPQPFSKAPRISEQARNPHHYQQNVYDYEANPDSRLSFSDGGGNSVGEEDCESQMNYSEMSMQGKQKDNYVKSERDHIQDKKMNIHPNTGQSHPSSSSHVTGHSPSNNSQVIDVDLTRAKEEMQDETFLDAENVAYQEGEEWSEDHPDDYVEEDYGDEEGYNDSNEEEFFTSLQEKTVGLYPVGFMNPNDNKADMQPSMSHQQQQFVDNQMMQTSQGGSGQLGSGVGGAMGDNKMMTKMGLQCDDCGKVFAGEAKLARHVQTAHLQLRFRCPICFVSYGRKVSLKKHMQNKHSTDGPAVEVSCPICEEAFTNQDQVHKHIFEVHRVNPQMS